MRKAMLGLAIMALVAGGSTACATKGYVKNQVNQVSGKVDSVSQALEQTQERMRQNEARIGEVDTRAGSAISAAGKAQESANTAGESARMAGETAKTADATAKTAVERADAVDKASKRIVFTVVLSEDKGGFKFNQTKLPDEAKTSIDDMVKQLLDDPKGAYFEIEGHTDNVGDPMINEKLGLARAETVKRYLYETYQIPLHRINTISYGEAKPVTDNKTKDNRAQNRRVVIRVLN